MPYVPGSCEMPGSPSDDRDVQHASHQVALALHEGAVDDGNYPERRVEVSHLRLELSGLAKVPRIHVLRVQSEANLNISAKQAKYAQREVHGMACKLPKH